jgi:methionyl-tRNA formyltransferase
LAANRRLPHTAQDDGQASCAPPLIRDTERIDWHKPAEMVHNLIRGLNPWPGSFCLHRGKILKIWRSCLSEDGLPGGQPGEVTAIFGDRVFVATGTGCVELVEVQPESRRRMACGEYARGNDLHVGEILD